MSPEPSAPRSSRRLLQSVAILAVIGGGVSYLFDRAGRPAPQAAIAPDLVAHLADAQMRLTRQDGTRWIVPQRDVRWSGLFDCERWRDPARNRWGSGGRYGNTDRGPQTWICVIGITGPQGEDIAAVVRLGYPSRRSSGQVVGYTLSPDVGSFHVFPVTGTEAVAFLASHGITATSRPIGPP